MPEAILGPIAGSVVGGLMSDGEEQTATKEPWAAAAPWLRENIAQGQNLQAYYQQNPFNQPQQTAYQNTFTDIDNFRGNMAPGLMDFANRLMGQNYRRDGAQQGPRPMQAQTKPMQMQGSSGGLLQQPGAFSAPRGQSYGLLDFQALNPYNGALKPAEIKQPDQQTIEQAVQAEIERQRAAAAQQSDRFA
jgi:hypothetical protein